MLCCLLEKLIIFDNHLVYHFISTMQGMHVPCYINDVSLVQCKACMHVQVECMMQPVSV